MPRWFFTGRCLVLGDFIIWGVSQAGPCILSSLVTAVPRGQRCSLQCPVLPLLMHACWVQDLSHALASRGVALSTSWLPLLSLTSEPCQPSSAPALGRSDALLTSRRYKPWCTQDWLRCCAPIGAPCPRSARDPLGWVGAASQSVLPRSCLYQQNM